MNRLEIGSSDETTRVIVELSIIGFACTGSILNTVTYTIGSML